MSICTFGGSAVSHSRWVSTIMVRSWFGSTRHEVPKPPSQPNAPVCHTAWRPADAQMTQRLDVDLVSVRDERDEPGYALDADVGLRGGGDLLKPQRLTDAMPVSS
jgi:hypothetical protein